MFHELQIFENPEAVLLVASIIFFFSIIAGKAGFLPYCSFWASECCSAATA